MYIYVCVTANELERGGTKKKKMVIIDERNENVCLVFIETVFVFETCREKKRWDRYFWLKMIIYHSSYFVSHDPLVSIWLRLYITFCTFVSAPERKQTIKVLSIDNLHNPLWIPVAQCTRLLKKGKTVQRNYLSLVEKIIPLKMSPVPSKYQSV